MTFDLSPRAMRDRAKQFPTDTRSAPKIRKDVIAMTEQKHTPGPWEAGSTGIITAKSATTFICDTRKAAKRFLPPNAEIMANARLIAAAPELLAVLEALADHAAETYPHFESHRGQVDLACARAAIAKAGKE